MATATQTRPTFTRPEQTQSVLDRTIEATEKRKSVVRKAASLLEVPPEKVWDVLRNVWRTSKGEPPLTEQEMFQGLCLVGRYELDPFTREIYVTRSKGRLITIIGVDGWIKILDRTDHYDGFDQEIHEGEDEGADWVETRIYSKKRSHPAVYRAFQKEYAQVAGPVAQQMPSHMLRIFSLRHAARMFVPLGSNVMTEEEAYALGATLPAADASAVATTNAGKAADLMVNLSQLAPENSPEVPIVPQATPAAPADITLDRTEPQERPEDASQDRPPEEVIFAEFREAVAAAPSLKHMAELRNQAEHSHLLTASHIREVLSACDKASEVLDAGRGEVESREKTFQQPVKRGPGRPPKANPGALFDGTPRPA